MSTDKQAGNVSFSLRATDTGLLIERTQLQRNGSRVVQTMVLTNAAMFDRWRACEPMRFDNPALFDHLRREGHDALRSQVGVEIVHRPLANANRSH